MHEETEQSRCRQGALVAKKGRSPLHFLLRLQQKRKKRHLQLQWSLHLQMSTAADPTQYEDIRQPIDVAEMNCFQLLFRPHLQLRQQKLTAQVSHEKHSHQ